MKLALFTVLFFLYQLGNTQMKSNEIVHLSDKDITIFKIYYPSSKSDFNLNQIEDIISLLQAKSKDLVKIKILGFCDTVGDANANQVLSEKRAEKISTYFINKKIVSNDFISFEGKGESNLYSGKEFYQNRRTEIILFWKNKEIHKEHFIKQGCNTIRIPEGAYEPHNLEDLEIVLEIIDTPEKIQKYKIIMEDEEGNGLISGGMFYFSVKYKGEELTPSQPIEIRIEANQIKEDGMEEYDGVNRGDSVIWGNTGNKLNKTLDTETNCEYYSFLMDGNGKKNADVKCKLRGGETPPDKREKYVGYYQISDSTNIHAIVFGPNKKSVKDYSIKIFPISLRDNKHEIFTQLENSFLPYSCEIIFKAEIYDSSGNVCLIKPEEELHFYYPIPNKKEPLLLATEAKNNSGDYVFNDTLIDSKNGLGVVNCLYYVYVTSQLNYYGLNPKPITEKRDCKKVIFKIRGKVPDKVIVVQEKSGELIYAYMEKIKRKKYVGYISEDYTILLKHETKPLEKRRIVRSEQIIKKKKKFVIRKR